ncbi:hypothetical protein [Nocardia wallacei]|uniref:hypothetical protein n=1 Tax=Nocardia wallacei TaxID=480035 RepID=UPI002457F519|nr:hypothetical protein [Nocardia wallacei]
MRDFAQFAWHPHGSRPHVFALPGPALHAACEQAVSQLPGWHRDWATIVTPVPARLRHLTVAWVDIPTHAGGPDRWHAAHASLTRQVSRLAPLTVTATAVTSTPGGIIITTQPDPGWTALTTAVGEALTEVYDRALVHIDTDPHVAVAYGCRDVDTDPLEIALPSTIDTVVDEVKLVDNDSFAAAPGWDHSTARAVALTGATADR